MLLLLTAVILIVTYVDASLVVVPRNSSVVVGTSVRLECSTNVTSRPVNWYCIGACSADTTAAAVHLFLAGVLTESYAHRVNILTNTTTTGRSVSHYDLHIASVTVDDDGVYTCVDKAGMGQTASASLSVLPRRSTQRRQITVYSSLTTSSPTSHSRFSTQQQDEASISLSRPLIAVVAVVASLTVIAVIGVIVYRYFVCNGKRHEFSPVQTTETKTTEGRTT